MRDIDLNEVLSIRAQESPPAPDETPPHPDLNEVLSIRAQEWSVSSPCSRSDTNLNEVLSIRAQESARVFLEFRVVRTSMMS